MLIGLTYDLRDDYAGMGLSEEALAEFDSPETVEALEGALTRAGHRTDRIGNIRALSARLVAGDRWDLVFNIAEGLLGRSREAQVPALLEAYGVPYTFSDPLTQAIGLDKAISKQIVRDAGLPTAPFGVIDTAMDVICPELPFPLFLKPLAEGTGKGCENASKVCDAEAAIHVAQDLIARFGQPVLAETYLPGREFTVGILGNGADARVIAVMEITSRDHSGDQIYSFQTKEHWEEHILYRLADDAEAREAGRVALAAYRVLQCRDAARIDLRSDAAGRPQFLEVNTLAGLHPTHSDLPILSAKAGMSYDDLITDILSAALSRIDHHKEAHRVAS
ncbi:D-alanine--D-alanine ligase family protein [Pseudaestuariivita atlantica]|uniref:D-alanine--D-alanine ligase n=1 Tax=Pseudaestuariivita atlantica TaxID=1317121 RepID=A0A0L1JJL7_9RHOB|nr:D-alanine--D-alanine ligase [Pseudaestuariivita atlantica]KNG91936.1 D-alanine--D-alanine ligase [Pseudaestuariivita atlantica]